MTKTLKSFAALLLVVPFLTACSNETAVRGGYPIIGTVAAEDIPFEPKAINHITADENVNIPNLSYFVGAAGELLTQDGAIHTDLDSTAYYSYFLEYDHAYFTYAVPLYDRKAPESNSEYYNIDTEEALDKCNLYLKNKAVIYTVSAGDKLENGLICTDALSRYVFDNTPEQNPPTLLCYEATFSGELTLTGTIHCQQEDSPIPGCVKGHLSFTADSDNGKVFDVFNPNRSYKITSTGETILYGETFQLGSTSDLTEEQAELIENNEYTNVRITIKNINLFYSYSDTSLKIAEITDIELI